MRRLIWRIGLQKERDRGRTMAERSQNLAGPISEFSSQTARFPLTIFLINGVKLTGVVTSFDNFCVLLRRDGHSQLVYKWSSSIIR
jgi:host factor-I protein